MPDGNNSSAMQAVEGRAIRLHANDTVVVAAEELTPGARVPDEDVIVKERVPPGHKLATKRIVRGEPIRKYNQVIGFASTEIAAGSHVHLHNLEYRAVERGGESGSAVQAIDFVPDSERATFQGIVRADGRIATRNYIGVLTSVNCSATVARLIADEFRDEALDEYPNVDGVVPLTHDYGCGGCAGVGLNYIQRTLAGYVRHPNFAAVVLVGLGCEANQIGELMRTEKLKSGERLFAYTIQDSGGTRAAVRRGVERIREMLPLANQVERQAVPANKLVLGLQCGGSDGYSGISANPALGAAVDLLVSHGGTACLGETPEIHGAEHLLVQRAVSREVSDKLMRKLDWWQDYTSALGVELNNNPSPGNKTGGLTTILEKSLGAVAKGGTTNLNGVYDYAQPIDTQGFVFMDSPGYDPSSLTGMVAGGANILCFTTGRGSVFGCKPAPSLKLATNTPMYTRMRDDMDINCGSIIDGEATVEKMGGHIFQRILATASGAKTRSELLGMGENEFVPWTVGAIL